MITDNTQLIVGTWGASGSFGGSGETIEEIIDYAGEIGISKVDSAMVYGRGAVDCLLSKKSGTQVITKIPAIEKEYMTGKYCNVERHYPREYLDTCVTSLVEKFGSCVDTLLLHNWHTSWDPEYFDDFKSQNSAAFDKFGISFDGEDSMSLDSFDVVEVPCSPILPIHLGRLSSRTSVLVRSIFLHGHLLKEITQTYRIGKVGKTTLESCKEFRERYPDIKSRIQAVFGFLDRQDFSIDGIIVGITKKNQLRQLQDALDNYKVTKSVGS